mmetsp:Transcript_2365/g.7822  ORF Transcript_2365/g.7822 Transcript_2365/m.7822 type:complete len:278 (+) Transcript_2365:402-1235(+)
MAPPHRLAGCRASMERPYTWAGPHPSCPSRSMCPIGDRSGRQQSCWALGRRSSSSGCTRQCRLGDSCYSTCRNRERSASSMSSSCSARCRQSSPQCLATASGASTGSSRALRGTRSRCERPSGSAAYGQRSRLSTPDPQSTDPCSACAPGSPYTTAGARACRTASLWRRLWYRGCGRYSCHREAPEPNPRTCTAAPWCNARCRSRYRSRAGSPTQCPGSNPRKSTSGLAPRLAWCCRTSHLRRSTSGCSCRPPGSHRLGDSASQRAAFCCAQSWRPR